MADTHAPDLGPMPAPRVEPGEPAPGGVDAIPDPDTHLTPDIAAHDNPAFEERAPEPVAREVDEDEDTSTKATEATGPGGPGGGGDAGQQLETSG